MKLRSEEQTSLIFNTTNMGKNRKIAQKLSLIVKPYKYAYLRVFLISFLFTILGFALSFYIKKITDDYLPNSNGSELSKMSFFVILIFIIQYGLSYFKDISLLRIGQVIDRKLILGYLSNVLFDTDLYYNKNRAGDVISKVNDSVKTRNFLTTGILALITNTLIMVFSLVLIFIYNWKLGLVISSILPVYFFIFLMSRKLNKSTERQIVEESSAFREEIISSLNNIKTVKVMGLEEYIYNGIEKKFIPFINTSFISARNTLRIQYSHNLISNLFVLTLLWVGSIYVMQGKISAGILFSCYFIFTYSLNSIQFLVNIDNQIQNAFISAERLFGSLEEQNNKKKELIAFDKSYLGNIYLQNIKVVYGDNIVFSDFNLEIRKNEITAIIGKSGIGKSSLVNLISKYITPKEGNVVIGSHDINSFDNTFKDYVTIVSQETELFNASFVENIHLGCSKPVDLERIKRIFKVLGLDIVVDTFPNGLFSCIGENGTILSGGQRQRLAIARALYKESQILVFDESTSALDNENINSINSLFLKLKQEGKTVVIITHKSDALRISDRVIWLGYNSILADGKHEDLKYSNSDYAMFCENTNRTLNYN